MARLNPCVKALLLERLKVLDELSASGNFSTQQLQTILGMNTSDLHCLYANFQLMNAMPETDDEDDFDELLETIRAAFTIYPDKRKYDRKN